MRSDGYWIIPLRMLLPKKFEFVLKNHVLEWFLELPKALNGRYDVDDGRMFFKFEDLCIEITSKSELFIIREIFIDRCYHFLMPGNHEAHVVDIGMNVGLASLFFAGLPFVKRVHSFEPFLTTFQMAKNNLANNPKRAQKVNAHNFGLGSTHAEINAPYDSENNGTNTSLVPRLAAIPSISEKLKIKPALETLSILFKRFPSENFILKIDTEGAEYEIFRSLFQEKLTPQVKGIMLEWHSQGSEELTDTLTKNGFILTSFRISANSGMIYGFR